MSIMQVAQERGIASPLMSNNPFRNKVVPTQSPIQPQAQTVRPVSTNPFLDTNAFEKGPTNVIRPANVTDANGVTDIFASMDINGRSQVLPQQQQIPKSQSRSPERRPRPIPNDSYGRPDNVPQRPMRSPPLSHRPNLSEEERRQQGAYQRRGTEMDIFADPPNMARSREQKSTRRNSESSVRDKPNLLDPEEARKRQERKGRDPQSGKYRPSRKMDVIDKLDVTSIYGAGLFHHDGPFDACNPNRNKKRHRYAPIHAFPKDSANMQIGGAGPVKPQMDYDKYHGLGQEAHIDFNEAAVVDEDAAYMRRPQPERSTSFNPVAFDAVHGQETIGLGTSTFLEGAPASRVAIQRRESEMNDPQIQMNGGGLSRKKSLAQKIRGVRGGTNRVQSPDNEQAPVSPLPTGKSDSFANPFFKDYDKEYERKGQQIAQAEEQAGIGRARATSSPKPMPALERQMTGNTGEATQESKPSGFLGRMKSLKKTKSRAERREAS